MTSTTELVEDEAAVVIAGAAYDVPLAVSKLAPGGRLVAVAADSGAAQRVANATGLELRHIERVGPRVAWSAVRPLAP
jgi:protein-L-isoaspartate O-methyltransferase